KNKREGEVCRTRIFTGTNDGRLFAIDAETGAACTEFANNGQYDLRADVGLLRWGGEYQVTSPPAIIGDRVVVGSAIADNQRIDTGAVVWHFQTVHHDLWDYDIPAEPALFTLRREDGTSIPALAQATKTGHLFILDRRTGEPVFGITEKPVPQAGVPGEMLSPTQPVPNRPPPLAAQRLRPEETDDKLIGRRCRDIIKGMRSEGIFSPPSF